MQSSMSRWTLLAVCGFVTMMVASPAGAQYHYHTNHHHHDAAGHRIDDYGHHIDNYGHHTGATGVYDQPRYGTGDYYDQGYGSRAYYNPGAYSGNYGNQYYASPGVSVYSPRAAYYPHGANVLPQQFSGAPIQISNPLATGGGLHYDLNAYHYDIGPGESQTLHADRRWVVSFDRGAGFGGARYTLMPGVYEFKPTDHGWDLYKQSSAALATTDAPLPPSRPAQANTLPRPNTLPQANTLPPSSQPQAITLPQATGPQANTLPQGTAAPQLIATPGPVTAP